MKKSNLLIPILIISLIFLISCTEQISDEELDKELEQLSEEELEYVLTEDKAIAGEAFRIYKRNPKLSKLRRIVDFKRRISTCSDNDLGRNYLTKGIAGARDKSFTDYCQDSRYLMEYDCGYAGGINFQDGCGHSGLGSCRFDCQTLGEGYVCKDGACVTEPALTLVFNNGGFEETEFEEAVEELVETFVNATPLRDCPEQVKVHKIDVCCPEGEDIAVCAERYIPKFDSAILLHPHGFFEEGCSATSSTPNSLIVVGCPRAFTHELGHSLFGFADQYCLDATYQGQTINPVTDEEGCGYSPIEREYTCRVYGICWNRETNESMRLGGDMCMSNEQCENLYGSGFECVSCFIPQEGTIDWTSCSQVRDPPVYCLGNPTPNNERSVMGTWGGEIEFDENEYNIIAETLQCR